jgi:hypothetical protein
MDYSRYNWKRIIFLVLAVILLGRYLVQTFWTSDESRIRRVIDKAEAAVTEKSFLKFQSILSNEYHDRSGLEKSGLIALATTYFRSQENIRIVRMNTDIRLESEDTARVNVRAQIFGESGGTWSHGLTNDSLMGEVFHIHLKKEDGGWKITSVNPDRRRWPRGPG